MFRAWYESPWHNPVLFLLTGVAFLAWGPRRLRVGAVWASIFGVEILLDAWLTGALTPFARHPAWLGVVAVPFVVLGDLRFFLFVERVKGGRWSRALGWSLVVPVLAFGAREIWPAWFHDLQRLFLVYELLFLGVAGIYARQRRVRDVTTEEGRWVRRVVVFEGTLYALWALADVAILAGYDAGFGLRLIPNTMYYAGFLPFVVATAPAAWRTT